MNASYRTKDVSVNGEVIPAGAMIQTLMAEILKEHSWSSNYLNCWP